MCNILLASNSVENKDEITSKLKNIDYEITYFEVDSSQKIMGIVEKTSIDLIIMDCSSLDDTSSTVCKTIKNTIKYHNIPILMVLPSDNSNLKKLSLNNGASAFVVKPIDESDLISKVNLLVRLKKSEEIIRRDNRSAEYGLSFSEKKYKDLFNTMTNAFAFMEVVYGSNGENIDAIFLEVNPAFEKITGYKSEHVVGKSIKDIFPNMSENWIKQYTEVIMTHTPKQFVDYSPILNKYLDVVAYTTKNKYLATTFRDVTYEIEMDKTVNKIHKELDQILNVASPLCVINNNHAIVMVNDSFCNLFQVDRLDVIGKSCQSVFGTTLCGSTCPLKRLKKIDDRVTNEITKKLKNGKYIKCLVTTRPYENVNNEIIGIVETFTDISRLKRVEDKLIRAKRKAEESDRLKSAFLANMSHEIRTPMNSIIGFSDLINENHIDTKTKKSYINIIQTAGNDLLNLIDDIIDIAKIEAGQINVKMESVSVDKLLFETYLTLNEHPTLKLNRVKLNLIKEKKTYKDTVLTDELRLKQILINIINNAIKFTHKGSIDFGYSKKGDFLEFYVKDTGIGLSKEQIDIIWERFRQGDDSTTKKYGGAGLGLSISKGLVKLLGGSIRVESEWKKGTTFYFTIPYVESIFVKEKPIKKSRGKFDWRERTILLAEDVDVNYKLLVEMLKSSGAKILRAKDGKECIELYKKNKDIISIILMDIQMPIINGYEAIKQIKKINKKVPILVQTAYAMNDDIKKCFDAGCDDYIAKPMVKEKLLNKINDLLSED